MTKVRKERQRHGFYFEDYAIESGGFAPSKGYTDPWDGYMEDGTPISVKVAKLGTEICFSDMFRQYEIDGKGFLLIVGFWKGEKTNIQHVYQLLITSKGWKSMFNHEALNHLKYMIETVGKGDYNSKEDKELWVKSRTKTKKIWKSSTPNIIRPRYKWAKPEDSGKSNHRIQCAIGYNNFMENFVYNPNFDVYVEDYREVDTSFLENYKVTETETVEDTKYGKLVTKKKVTETTKTTKTTVTEKKVYATVKEYADAMDREIKAELRAKAAAKKKSKSKNRRGWK